MGKDLENDMQLTFNAADNILAVKWRDELSVESALFSETIVALFNTIKEKQISKLIIDSGKPAGGVLTDGVINYFIQNIPGTTIRYVALLESTDYLWDQNLLQVLNLLIDTHQIPVSVNLVQNKANAEEWLSEVCLETER